MVHYTAANFGINWVWLNRQPVMQRNRIHPPCTDCRIALRCGSMDVPAGESFCQTPRQGAWGQNGEAGRNPIGTILHRFAGASKGIELPVPGGRTPEPIGPDPLEEVFRGIIEVLPQGWQHPHDCQARIIFENLVVQSPDFQTTPWVQKASIAVQGEAVGAVEVSYRQEMPSSDRRPVPEGRTQAD